MARPTPKRPAPATVENPRSTSLAPPIESPDDGFFPVAGERLRRLALGSLAALIACRPFFPGEDASRGTGMVWVLLLLIVAAIGILATILSGSYRPRFSLVDVAFLGLVLMIGMSAGHASDRRAAIILGWEWGGLAIAYMLARQLPRTKAESQALLGVLAASAVAVAAYGLYQVQVELAQVRNLFLANPESTLASLGIASDSSSRAAFEDRLLGSNEPWSTFALTNSLAGFLVGPLMLGVAIAIERLRKVEAWGSKIQALILAAIPGLILTACLLATKSRSAYLGAAFGLGLIALRAQGKVSGRLLAGLIVAGVVGMSGLIAVGIATNQLDLKVITESSKSLRYRVEYWRGTWELIKNHEGVFWGGLGPGNFGTPYLLYKLPESSEEIVDPHNFVLETWSTAGLPAVLALMATLALGFGNLLGSSSRDVVNDRHAHPRSSAPRHATWLVCAGGLGWLLVCFLGSLNPFQEDLTTRWIILGMGFALAATLASPLWRGTEWPVGACGPVVLAIVINLLAAGGIGIPPVALGLWMPLALGLNLRADRGCGALRTPISSWWFCIPACFWAAIMGTFVGAIGPHWRSQGLIAQADAILRRPMPDYELASKAFRDAAAADPLASEPWLGLADLEYSYYRSPASQGIKNVWNRILITYDKALSEPRPNTVATQRRRAGVARNIYSRLGENAVILDDIRLLSYINRANRLASQMYPSSAILHAELALSSSNIGMYPDAVKEAHEALRLSELTPHLDKKLTEKVTADLQSKLADWAKAPLPEEIRTKP